MALKRAAASLLSAAAKMALITAIPAIPVPARLPAFSSEIPPMATTGTETAAQMRFSSSFDRLLHHRFQAVLSQPGAVCDGVKQQFIP